MSDFVARVTCPSMYILEYSMCIFQYFLKVSSPNLDKDFTVNAADRLRKRLAVGEVVGGDLQRARRVDVGGEGDGQSGGVAAERRRGRLPGCRFNSFFVPKKME